MAAISDVIFTTLFPKWPHKKTKIMFVMNSYCSSINVVGWVGGVGWGEQSETEFSLTGKKANRRGSGTWVRLAELDSKGPLWPYMQQPSWFLSKPCTSAKRWRHRTQDVGWLSSVGGLTQPLHMPLAPVDKWASGHGYPDLFPLNLNCLIAS